MLATSVAVAQSATSQPSPSSAAPTQTATVTIAPPMIDFGVIKPGSRQNGEFKIQNRGQTAITIESAFPSCKCTTLSDIAGKIIQPGGDLELLASLDAPRTPGEKDAKVFVKIMSVEQPLIAKMQGVVQLPLLIQPVFIDALKESPRELLRSQIRLRLRFVFSLVMEWRLNLWTLIQSKTRRAPAIGCDGISP